MKSLLVLSVVLALAVGLAGARQWVPLVAGAPEQAPAFRVVSSNFQRTVVELTLDGIYSDEVTAGGRAFQRLDLGMAGGGVLTMVGSPALPVVARLISIPSDRAVTVRVLESDEVSLGGYNVYPAQPPLPENRRSQPFVIDEKRYLADESYPESNWTASDPMIMRDYRVVQLVLQPVRANPVTGELRVARRLRVELTYNGRSDINVRTTSARRVSRAFDPLYRRFIANYDVPPADPENGSYLIITPDAFLPAVQPFAAWKQRKGWRVKVATTTEIGGADTAHVFSYIHNAYTTWPYPPDYVLLVGDAPSPLPCCHWPGYTDASDLYFTLHEGSDILADMLIGRVCVTTLADAQAVLNKLYKYESDPYMGNTAWFSRVCALAGYEGSSRFWSTVISIRDYTMGHPFTQFDTLFERWGANTAANLSESLNQGRSWMLYRGHGDVQAWANVTPSWTNTNVNALNNGRMTPMVIAPTCLSGDFDSPSGDCHAEAWLKAGEAKGGCGYFGSSEVSYTGHNDSLAAGAFYSYADSLDYGFAQCTQFGKLFMMEAFPLPDEVTEEETYMFNSFGDPELMPWSAVPRALAVGHPATVLIGSFPFPVTVNAGDAPVAGALVCVMSANDSTVFHVGHTDASGSVQFTINATLPGDSLFVTVTGRNLRPYLGSVMTIAPNSAYITYLRHVVDDAAGNNDGIINPGETIELPVWLRNWGSVTATGVAAKLRATDPSITLTDTAKSFGTIAAGDSAWTGVDGFGFTVAPACTNGYVLRFSIVTTDANDSVWTSALNLSVGTPVIGYVANVVNDEPPGGNGDGKVDPGETAELIIRLGNLGLGHGYNVGAVLRSGDSRFVVQDSVGAFGTILRDSTGSNTDEPFVVYAEASIPREFVVPCTLLVTADGGYSRRVPFGLTVGEVRSMDPIPDGPRAPALYWAYEDADSLYTAAPVFAWAEISGLGTRLTLSDDQTQVVSLPPAFGPFRFYNQNYTQVSICGNGWVGLGSSSVSTYTETALPNSSMPPGFYLHWDDMYPPAGGGVWYYHDAANHRFIVEYDSVPLYSAQTDFQKFQVIFYDTTLAAFEGNCVADVQYLMATSPNSCTVGEQDPTMAIAIQCLFDGVYHRGSSPVTSGRVIRFTTTDATPGVNEWTKPAGAGRFGFSVLPNPVRGSAVIRFALDAARPAKVAVYDQSGRLVRELAGGVMEPGEHVLAWDGTGADGRRLAQGVYFVRLVTTAENRSVKTLLLK